MIYSKKHNFLFLKGVKVGGTSVEIALSKLCGDEDIITPIANIDERTRVQSNIRHAQNYGPSRSEIREFIEWILVVPTEQITRRQSPKGHVRNHMPLRRIYRKLGKLHPEIREANILAIVRSPYQQILSSINHKINIKRYMTSGRTMRVTPADLRKGLDRHIAKLQRRSIDNFQSRNYQIYDSSFDDSIHVQFIRFENLTEGLNQTLKTIGVDETIDLPFAKKGIQSSNDLFREIATNKQIDIINDYHKKDFARFGYEMIRSS